MDGGRGRRKKANEKYLNMTADDRELGTGFYNIQDYKFYTFIVYNIKIKSPISKLY